MLRDRVQTAAFLVLAVLVLSAPFVRGDFSSRAPISGFGAFYCAGRAVGAGRDPYRTQPLLDCERSLPSYHYDAVGVVEPAPLPPFVLLGFAALSLLPFGWALAAFLAASVAAVAAATWALDRITGLGVPFVGTALLFTALYANLVTAEVPPLVIGLLALAARLAERQRPIAAALVAAPALIEPHVAAPVIAAMFLAYRPARWPLIAAAAVALAASLAALGPTTTLEYFARALPAHAAAEVSARDQYSLTWILHQLGASDGFALLIGSASYAVAAALGIGIALRLAARYRRPALVVLLPAAFAMLGGSFIHDIQLPIALPAAVVLLGTVAPRLRVVVLAGIVLLAVPWYGSRIIWAAAAAVAVLTWYAPIDLTAQRRSVWAAGAALAYAAAVALLAALPDTPAAAVLPNVSGPPDELASAVWRRFVLATAYGRSSVRSIAEKLPYWAGLLAVVTGAALALRSPNPRPADASCRGRRESRRSRGPSGSSR